MNNLTNGFGCSSRSLNENKRNQSVGHVLSFCQRAENAVKMIVWRCHWLFIPGREFIFLHVWSRGSLVLDSSQNKSQLRFLLRAHGNWQIMWRLIWARLTTAGKGFPFFTLHTPTRPLDLPTPRILEDMGL